MDSPFDIQTERSRLQGRLGSIWPACTNQSLEDNVKRRVLPEKMMMSFLQVFRPILSPRHSTQSYLAMRPPGRPFALMASSNPSIRLTMA